MNGVNVPLLRKAVEWAEAEAAKPPELCEWNQRYYVVPTTEERQTTFAGDPVMDPTLRWDGRDWVADVRAGLAAECGTCYCIAGYIASLTGEPVTYNSIAGVAQHALGITGTQSSWLFRSHNTIEDVRSIAEEIAGEAL